MADTISTGARPRLESPQVVICISPVIEREFKRRGVFPELRLEAADRIVSGATGVHRMANRAAEELLADAKAMYSHGHELPRGAKVAYAALVRNVEAMLKQEARRGLSDDPGMAVAAKRAAESPACLVAGTAVLYFRRGAEYGVEAVVSESYGLYAVAAADGPYITSDGARRDYRFGYIITRKGCCDGVFVPPHTLTRADCKPTHLCLVEPRPAASPRSWEPATAA